ncbi:MAG TPA: thioesterase family protein [Spirochaetota bacterium]|nr:thioesterase family protein [Spirochaetota bacterium]HPJ33810.1 thioesterase family protein [Spirochaetota bacterium]
MKGEVEIKVRGYHLDIYAHVNNARYVEFLEEGRWALFDDSDIGKEMISRGFAFTVVNINVSYLSEARANDVLVIVTEEKKVGNKSITLSQKIFRKADMKQVVDAEVTFVLFNMKTGKAVVIDDEIKSILCTARTL